MRNVLHTGLGALLTGLCLISFEGCSPECAEWKSPCVKPFDVATWCGKTNCSNVDGMATDCAAGTCAFVNSLSVPVGHFIRSLKGHELVVVDVGFCGDPIVDSGLITSIDGVPAVHYASG